MATQSVTYVYLKPELSEKGYIYMFKMLLPIILLFGIVTSAYYLGKYSWQKQPCDGNMAPGIAALYGWSSNEYVKRCIPKVRESFGTMESSKYETPVSFFESILQQFSTKISLAMKTLKA
jgi:hypothetical protein